MSTRADAGAVVSGYDATSEAADGLALAHLLAVLGRRRLLVARVIRDVSVRCVLVPAEERHIRDLVGETRAGVLAVLPDESVEVVPLIDHDVISGLHDFARHEGAAILVLGSTHRGTIGRTLLGGTASMVADGAPCPIAVAPPGFRARAQFSPLRVGVGWDGSAASRTAVAEAADFARSASAPLHLIHVTRRHHDDAAQRLLDEGLALARALVPDIEVDGEVRVGSTSRALIDATNGDVGLLVLGSRGHRALARVLLGSTALDVTQRAHAPVIVIPGDG